jgi:isocitrate dehydrogenase
MKKIVVAKPVVELDGDEMTRIIWKKIREEVSAGTPFHHLAELNVLSSSSCLIYNSTFGTSTLA